MHRLFVLLCLVFAAAIAHAVPAPPLLRPLSLDAALGYATDHNPALLRTREQIREQQGVWVEVRSAQLPAVSASGGYTRLDRGVTGSPLANDSTWSADITARQVLYAGGGIRASIKAQRELLEAAKFTFSAALNDTLLAVRRQFYDVLLARELVGVQEEALRVLEAELANARQRGDAGTVSSFEVLRAEVAVANAKPALIRARNSYRVAQDRLRATLGAPVDSPAAPAELALEGTLLVSPREISLADALSAARSRRPELLAQERLITAATESIAAARSGYKPSVSAVAGYEWSKPALSTTGGDRLDGWTAGVQANWAIFDGRATAGRVAQARSRAAQAQLSREERQLGVDIEVREAHSSLVESAELLTASSRVIEQARESLRLARARFGAGTATQLDVLQAQSALTAAQSNLASARHGYAVALAALHRATGQP
jgi:outer membrane protein TolC